MVFDSDDFGATHVISDMCQSHDCRDVLTLFKEANPKFKATLFTIPHETTPEILRWAYDNRHWIELAWHGFAHESNYECSELVYDDFELYMQGYYDMGWDKIFVKGFKAPGWQISDGVYDWLVEHDFWVADQAYNDDRRPEGLKVYKVGENSVHTHTWNCVGNGVYELFDEIMAKVKEGTDWKFVSEVV